MRRIYWLLLLLICPLTQAQSLSVTATITDTDGQTWNNGTFRVQLMSPNGAPNYNGAPVSMAAQSGSLDGSGSLAVSLYNSSTITPGGAYYQWLLCSNTSAQCASFNSPVTNTNMSSTLSARVTAPRVAVNLFTYAYADTEIFPIPAIGGVYYNVTNSIQRIWNGTAFVNNGGGSSSNCLSLTTNNSSGPSQYNSTTCVLNIPVYTPLAGTFIESYPTASQILNVPSGTTFNQTMTNNGAPQSNIMNIISANNVGQGYDLGNPWSTFNTITEKELNTVRGNNQMNSRIFNNYAVGDANLSYDVCNGFGGKLFYSDEGFNCRTTQMHQVAVTYGTLYQPKAGGINGPFAAVGVGNTWICTYCVFPTTGAIQTVQVYFPNTTTTQTAQIAVGTLGPGGTITYTGSQIVTVTIPAVAGAHTQSFTVGTNLPSISANAGQVLSWFQTAGESPSGSSYTASCIPGSGAITAGTFNVQTGTTACNVGIGYYGGIVMAGFQYPPVPGATSIATSPVNYFGYNDYNIGGPQFADGGMVFDDTTPIGTAVVGTNSNSIFQLSSGTVPASTGYGTLSGCSGSGNGETQIPVLVSCTATLISGAFIAPVSFTGSTTNGSTLVTVSSTTGLSAGQILILAGLPIWDTIASVGSGTVTMTTAATATNSSVSGYVRTNLSISGNFSETAAIASATALSGSTQTITFYSTYPATNHNGETLGQGGMSGAGIISTAALSVWPVLLQVVASPTSSSVLLANCSVGICFGLGTVYSSGTAVTFFPVAFVNGTNGGISGSAQLLANDMPDNIGDVIYQSAAFEYSALMDFEVWGQTSNTDAAQPSGIRYTLHDGPEAPVFDWKIVDNPFLAPQSTFTMFQTMVHYQNNFYQGYYPTSCFACWTNNSGSPYFTLFGLYNLGSMYTSSDGFGVNTNFFATSFNGVAITNSGSATLFLNKAGSYTAINTIGGALSSGNLALASGAGTGATAVISGYDSTFYVQLTTGTSPAASSEIFQVTFTASRGHASSCTFSPMAGGVAAALYGTQAVGISSTGSTVTTITSGSVALAAGTLYEWTFNCP